MQRSRLVLLLCTIGVLAAVATYFLLPGQPGGSAWPGQGTAPGPAPARPGPVEETSGSTPAGTPAATPSALPSVTLSPIPSAVPAATSPKPAVQQLTGTIPANTGPAQLPEYGPTPPPGLPPGPAQGDPYTLSSDELAAEIHGLVNQQRVAGGLPALASDTELAAIALGHSQDMADNNYFSHVDPRGMDPTARGEAAGFTCRKEYGSYYTYGIAENIFQNNRYSSVTHYSDGRNEYDWNSPEEIAQSTVGGWMNSSGHRKNILTAGFDREGIGVAIATDDKVYITEDFC